MRKVAIWKILLWALLPAVLESPSRGADFKHQGPRIILWAWERPERLSFIDPREIAIAYLAETFVLQGDHLEARPRLQPLEVPRNTYVIAVFRVETDRRHPPLLSIEMQENVVSRILKLAEAVKPAEVQIDFDAAWRERSFYREFLSRLRAKMPKQVGLSITALASWCLGDRWMSELPIDEAVPMLFRIGPDRRQVREFLAQGRSFPEPLCRNSFGISTDEWISLFSSRNRIYIFTPTPWTRERVEKVLSEVKSWR